MQTKKGASSNANISQALSAIHNNGVICYPTEGVWGLGCHPTSASAFERLITLKQRSTDKGMILLAADMAQLADYADIDDELHTAIKLLNDAFVTCILPKAPTCPAYLSGAFDSIAVRLTHYAPLRDLCLAADTPLVSTSANLSGQSAVHTLGEARAAFGDAVDVYIDDVLGGQEKPSCIIAWREDKTWETLRE